MIGYWRVNQAYLAAAWAMKRVLHDGRPTLANRQADLYVIASS